MNAIQICYDDILFSGFRIFLQMFPDVSGFFLNFHQIFKFLYRMDILQFTKLFSFSEIFTFSGFLQSALDSFL